MKLSNYVIFLWLLCDLTRVGSWRSFVFRFNAIKCTKKSPIAAYLNCSITKLRRNQEGVCLNMRFDRILQKPRIDLLILNMRGKEREFVLFNVSNIDGCQFLENNGSFRILQILRREFEMYSILPKQCPVPKETEINVRNLTLDPNNFPPYVPEVNFTVYVQMWESITPIWEVIINGSVESRTRMG